MTSVSADQVGKLPDTYSVDGEAIRLHAYQLLSYFYANKEIARRSDPDSRDDHASTLEHRFFFAEVSKLLLSIAISLRVLDDKMRCLPATDDLRSSYEGAKECADRRYRCIMFESLSLREVCNKIIHAKVVEPHFQEGSDDHELDELNWLAWSEGNEHADSGADPEPEPEPVKWQHLTCNIRLGGRHHGKEWWHLLEVPNFVSAVCELLSFERAH